MIEEDWERVSEMDKMYLIENEMTIEEEFNACESPPISKIEVVYEKDVILKHRNFNKEEYEHKIKSI